MKKIIYIYILFLFTNSIKAQSNYQLVYDYISHSDSIKKDKLINENVFVIGNNTDYYYLSENAFTKDTIQFFEEKKGTHYKDIYTKLLNSPKTNLRVGIKVSNNNLTVLANRLMDGYNFTKKIEEPQWEITNKVDTISSYKVKLATTYYLGRKWEAWYSEDIPISLAPYIFVGLPGTIIKLNDSQDYFKWELKSIKKVDNFEIVKLIFNKKLNQSKNLSPINFKLAFDDFNNNPMKFLEASGVSVDEERYKKLENTYHNKKTRYLDINIPKLL
ncbi:GLPGLI family protein [Chishuiella sp.]|uniref:GLPGLI family protein n=1 Tax=Chishuiella sp. TaxID=1969467 RepID=UPI0028ADA480|nr:GLPGLI family protein [Chishuiella sp.]